MIVKQFEEFTIRPAKNGVIVGPVHAPDYAYDTSQEYVFTDSEALWQFIFDKIEGEDTGND